MNNLLIDSEVLEKFKWSLSDSIANALQVANEQGKEVELAIKMGFNIEEDFEGTTMKVPQIDFKVTRKIKESKLDFSGEIEDIGIIFDENGKPKLINTNNQTVLDTK